MCAITLSCPLCCNEKFDSKKSLKCHIFNIINNLLCPICKVKFGKLVDLADHLSRDCGNREKDLIQNNNITLENNSTIDNLEVEEVNEIQNKINTFTGNSIPAIGCTSILEKALLSGSKNINKSTQNEVKTTSIEYNVELKTEEQEYYCQMCEISFNSIDDHLERFHEGQEILLQTEADEEGEEILEVDQSQDVEADEDTSLYVMNSDIIDESVAEEPILLMNETLQTIDERECTDSDGRVYTQKFVKIGEFWNKNAIKPVETTRTPIIEQFVIGDDGKTTKLTSNVVVEDSNFVITLHSCPKCHLQFSELSNFENHKCNLNAAKKYICSECEAEFYGPKALCAHMKLHAKKKAMNSEVKPSREGPFQCNICNTIFQTFKSLRLHSRMHDPLKWRPMEPPASTSNLEDSSEIRDMFICYICNKTFDKEYEEVHLNSHNSTIMDYDCTVCNRKFYTQANLDMHMKAHTNTKKFTCSYCKKPFVTYDALQDHISQQCQKRQYECQYCGRRFTRPHEKVKHQRIHTGEKPHICELCGKSFRVSYCLTLHMRTHSGQRPYHCEHCNKRFKSHSVYNNHLLTHSEERNYKCPFCPKAFKTSVQLAGHKNSHIKPFTCTECNRPFASLYAVRTHMETHKRSNNLKFDCIICGASYARSSALKDHVKEQHSEDLSSDKIKILSKEEIEATNSILTVASDEMLIDIATDNSEHIIEMDVQE